MESVPPVMGFNNNVRYRGMRFHIQTEDSGVARPHIITHLFADGGHVIKSIRTEYSEYVDHPDRPAIIQKLMREQHRGMALDLRDGRLDATIDKLTQNAAKSDAPTASVSAAPPEATPLPAVTPEPLAASPTSFQRVEAQAAAPPSVAVSPTRVPSGAWAAVGAETPKVTRVKRASKPPAAAVASNTRKKRGRRSQVPAPKPARSQPPARKPGRPSAALTIKSSESIFGAAPQESLDDVILSYVSHSKNGPPTRGQK
jgi:hypothetical protein